MLAAETCKLGDCIGLSHIQLEVNEANCEHKDVSLIENFGEEAVLIFLDVTKLTYKVLSAATIISVPRGWVWGEFRPYRVKSMRAKDMPSVLRLGNLSTFTAITLDPSQFAVFLRIWSLEKKKSLAVTSFGSLQNEQFVTIANGDYRTLP
ncbi:hypothetical protein CJ030_MR7G000088 [Morella rubra]|uniref:Uncharacterized protein n=1 Tax=Morella rubra TaxID=262757 RepID=A0A6A1V2H1_9ROSI|nr:hypothetical protein CJ030_MR7G000088 [Morella rubra]